MSNLEHYFENLLFHGQDIKGDLNKNTLTEAEQAAVWICVNYVLYDIFLNRDDFLRFVNGNTKADRIRHMSDEELAKTLSGEEIYPWCKESCKYIDCYDCVLAWLKQEAE